ncbi:tetratricopeptide repeat protein [Burkholderiaceae bacterium DAT-1]|nr:tetratricopeptide repeat protein [Burkholderiaceae bacterium DAT-1]
MQLHRLKPVCYNYNMAHLSRFPLSGYFMPSISASSKRLVASALSCALVACASIPAPNARVAEVARPESDRQVDASPVESAAVPSDADRYPKQVLTPEFLFRSLLADIAAQRGEFDFATGVWLEMARSNPDPRVAQRALEVAAAGGYLSAAAEAATIWRKLDSTTIAPVHAHFTLMARAGKFEEAQQDADTLLAMLPAEKGTIMLQVSAQLAQLSDKAKAVEQVRSLVERHPGTAEGYLSLAIVEHANAQIADGLAHIDQALNLRPNWEYAQIVKVRMMEGRPAEEIVRFAQSALSAHPDSFELRKSLAKQLVSQNKFAEAFKEYEVIGTKQPEDAEVALGAALSALQLRRYADAERALLRAQTLPGPNVVAVLYYLGVCADELRHDQDAVTRLGGVLSGEFYLPARMRMIKIAVRNQDVESMKAAIAAMPEGSDDEKISKIQLESQAWREFKQPAQSLAVLDRGLIAFPQRPELLYDRSLLLEQAGRVDDAERDLRDYLKQKPDNAAALNALGYTLANRTTRLAEAEELIRQALQKEPDNPVILDSLGWVLYKQGKAQDALVWLERAFSAMPDPEVAAHYGEVLWRSGKQSDAEKVWSRGRELSPNDQVLRETVQRLTGK